MSTNAGAPVVCFGEMLLRLTPRSQTPLVRTNQLAVDVGGAEANVACALASLGRSTRMVTVLPDNPLGRMVQMQLAAAGVDTRAVVKTEGRMGLYFYEPPTGPIAGRVTYDRADSAFALADAGSLDFAGTLEGAALLHISGITPALGPRGVALAREAVEAAKHAGVPICFDGNYRANLWSAWDCDPRAILRELVGEARVLIGNHRDISLLLGETFSGDGPERRRMASEAAFAEFPNLELIASTARHVETGAIHRITARIDLRGEGVQTEEARVEGIVDRIGTGDAFAAGLLLRYLEGASAQEMAKSALALAVMKHGLPGDTILVTRRELEEFDLGGGDVRR
ncbi:sugar kinase [Altericroceibacterium xinjiangense]|uniref:sugar kinase n=1 Tax=Altericroceibacterium xinjiangense TaxID=762261 RepID=UPI000F7DB927|nr:sugar kinase [Altericroceibacterium xinjiangense]